MLDEMGNGGAGKLSDGIRAGQLVEVYLWKHHI
jgi:hypothetical protein